MKKRYLIAPPAIIIIAGMAILIAYGFLATPEVVEEFNESERILGAHRGNSVNYTENTIPAFESALEEDRYNFVEFDIQYTKDKKLIVFHDGKLRRLQGINEWIEDLTHEELKNISQYHIPTYEETMELLAGKKPLNIEIKSQGNQTDDEEIVDYVIDDCKKRGILNTTALSSISSDVLLYIHQNYPEVKTGKIYYVLEDNFIEMDWFLDDVFEEMDRIDSEYLMVYGANLQNYGGIKKHLRQRELGGERKIFLVIWYFNDEMYIIYRLVGSGYYNKPASHYNYTLNYSIDLTLKERGAWWV